MLTESPPLTDTDFEAHAKLSTDLRRSARDLPRRNARYLVDTYYQVQKFRVRTGNQRFAADRLGESGELLSWTQDRFHHLEKQLASCLNEFSKAYRVGNWMQSLCGVGPVISAGLLAQIDIRKAPTVGHIWRFAGLDPSLEWLGTDKAKQLVNAEANGEMTEEAFRSICGKVNRHPENVRALIEGTMTKASVAAAIAKRPYSTPLKTLCVGKLGPCFVKVQGRKSDFYGALYKEHKNREIEMNERGDFAETAAQILQQKNFGKQTEAYKAYSEGRLPAGHIDRRAIRWVVKLFLSHLHQVMFEDFHGEKGPRPYCFDHLPNHTHFIDAPNWPGEFKGKRLGELVE